MNWRLFLSQADSLAENRIRLSGLNSLGSLLLLLCGALQVLIAIATGQGWLFLLGAAQLLIIPLTQTARSTEQGSAPLTMEKLEAGFTAARPWTSAAIGGAQRVTITIWQVIVRFLWSVAVGLTVGLLVLGWFSFQQPELWRWGTLQMEGPPLAAMVVTMGTTLLTMLGTLWVLNWKSCAR